MRLKSGDKIKFGIKYCNKTGRKDLMNKTIMLTPQYFDYDNGLYCETQECPGIYDEKEEEADSIYHLFGNHLENFHDCILIEATEDDLRVIDEAKKAEEERICKQMGDMAEFFEKETSD